MRVLETFTNVSIVVLKNRVFIVGISCLELFEVRPRLTFEKDTENSQIEISSMVNKKSINQMTTHTHKTTLKNVC